MAALVGTSPPIWVTTVTRTEDYVPSSGAFDPGAVVDVPLFWQQWRLRSELIERVASAVAEHASRSLH